MARCYKQRCAHPEILLRGTFSRNPSKLFSIFQTYENLIVARKNDTCQKIVHLSVEMRYAHLEISLRRRQKFLLKIVFNSPTNSKILLLLEKMALAEIVRSSETTRHALEMCSFGNSFQKLFSILQLYEDLIIVRKKNGTCRNCPKFFYLEQKQQNGKCQRLTALIENFHEAKERRGRQSDVQLGYKYNFVNIPSSSKRIIYIYI